MAHLVDTSILARLANTADVLHPTANCSLFLACRNFVYQPVISSSTLMMVSARSSGRR